jgi:acyl-CoA synthetase (AMP-forming)/AMP-acid ligase II
VPTIGGTVLLNARRVPDREALVAGPAGGRRWTWSELDAEVARVAGALEQAGLQRGDRFALMSANRPEVLIASFAALRLGALVVPVNARLAAPEIAHVLHDSAATVVVAEDDLDPVVDTAAHGLSSVRFTLGEGGRHPDLLSVDATPLAEDRADEADDAYVLYTSGTTGRPKGVLLDHHRAVWAAMAQVLSLGLRDGERYLQLGPLYHSGGVVFTNATTLVGGTNVLLGAFDPGALLEAVERERITTLLGVPTMYEFLLRHPDLRTRDLSSWRTGVFGAAPMAASTIETLVETFPTTSFFQQCGQTEAGPTGLYSTAEQVRAEPDSSGHLAQPGLEFRVVGEGGSPVTEPGEVGELQFRGEPVMKGYWQAPEATASALQDGWLRTGDLVRRTPLGGWKLVDRLKDVIITGGRNVYSAEVELALLSHPDVVDCAVVGRPHPDWGATVVAVVNPRPGAEMTLAGVREHLAPLIADYKIPRELRVSAVPRTASGKVQKHLVRELLDGR